MKIKCPICKKSYEFEDFKEMSKVGEWKLPRDWSEVLDNPEDYLVFEMECKCGFVIERRFRLLYDY